MIKVWVAIFIIGSSFPQEKVDITQEKSYAVMGDHFDTEDQCLEYLELTFIKQPGFCAPTMINEGGK